MFFGLDLSGLGKDDKKDKTPAPPLIHPSKPSKSPALLPKWAPIAIGAAGLGIVLLILLTSKGKD